MPQDPITVTYSAAGLFPTAKVRWGDCAIVGYGDPTNSDLNNKAYRYSRLSEIKDMYGIDSGLYRAAELFFLNGGSILWTVQAECTAEINITRNGDGSTRKFLLSPDVTTQAALGSIAVSVDGGDKVEGEDYIVDYSTGAIYFKVAPGAGAGNIAIDFREISPTHLENALVALESVSLHFVAGAFLFHASYAAKLAAHITTCETNGKMRMILYSGTYADYTVIKTTATGDLDTKRAILFANNSGYADENTDWNTWTDFNDDAVLNMAMISALAPWMSAHFQPLEGIKRAYVGFNFTPTQEGDPQGAAADSLFGRHINVVTVPNYFGAAVLYGGWTSDQSRLYSYIDVVRTLDYIRELILTTISNPNFIGKMQVNRVQLERLEATVMKILNDLYEAGAIADPKMLPFTHDGLKPFDCEALNIMRKPARERTINENLYINALQNDRNMSLKLNVDYQGAVHFMEIELAPS